jgi:Tol biopolymer transport system component
MTLARPNLVYAVKDGTHITVHSRNVVIGEERELLAYDERVEAAHDGNLWRELPPSIALNGPNQLLVYAEQRDVLAYDLLQQTTTTLLRREQRDDFTDLSRYSWLTGEGVELCCAYGLHLPVISPDGSSVVLSMSQWEGDRLGIVRTDGSHACVVSPRSGQSGTSLSPAWNPKTQDLAIPSGGEYAAAGLFVAPSTAPCSERDVAAGMHDELASFEAAVWSPEGDWIAATLLANVFDPASASLLLMRPDGSDARVLAADGFNMWPLFSPDGSEIYFTRREQWIDRPGSSPQSLWRYDLEAGEALPIVNVPDGWYMRSQGWTEEGYLALLAYRRDCGYYWSCDDRFVLLDIASGGVIYASAVADFASYLGFLP